MKIYPLTSLFINFEGQRKDRQKVEQLKKNNPYGLNPINQRQISESIENLASRGGKDNVDFLLNVSNNLKYGTNINLGKKPNNDWAGQLQNAARSAIEKSPEKIQPKLYAKMDKLSSAPKPLSAAEREILELRNDILNKVDRKELQNIQNENIRNLDRNFDYLISSSEITVNQKLYILKKLNYFMSPRYKINKLLADKKTQALAEIVNDMVIDTPESKIPNIKAVNQLTTGICAAISICRKNLVYEDKANYIDMILSELDDKDYMMIYDISKLGSGKKIPVAKPYIDFEYALQKGFRIIDASALNWMKVADTTGRTNNETANYVAFDKEYFDTFTDIHLISDISEELSPEQDYYRALLQAKSALKNCKKADIKKKIDTSNKKKERKERFDNIQQYSRLLTKYLSEIAPQAKPAEIRQLFNGLSSLEADVSTDIDKCKDGRKPYMYVPNEPESRKTEKIKSYIAKNIAGAGEISDEKAKDILELLGSLKELNSDKTYSAAAKRVITARRLYKAAAAYRVQMDFGLENDYRVCDMLKNLGLPDRETLILQNLDTLVAKLDKGTLNPAVKEILSERFQTEYNDDEALKVALETNRDNLENMLTETLDALYQSCTLPGRRELLLKNVTAAREAIFENNDGDTLKRVAYDMDMEADKRKICKELDKYIDELSSETLSNKDYTRIYNKMGGRNRMLDFKTILEELGKVITEDSERAAKVRSELNTANGLPADAAPEETLELYKSIVDNFNALSTLTSTFQGILEVRDNEGKILNTVVPKEIIMKKLEDEKMIIPQKDLKNLQNKFLAIEGAMQKPDGTKKRYKDLPDEMTTFTKQEKEVLKLIGQNINSWYSSTTRSLDSQYRDIEEPLSEHYRKLGVLTGSHWISNEGYNGLMQRQEIKLLESMTDRPYYEEDNGQKAVDRILASPYSGISGMSMASDQQAMHAQYIVDIKPVKIKTKDGDDTKYALFHDNTWGPAEHENIWIDENGLIRTDFAQDAGGANGFITGKDYRTGLFFDELFEAVGEKKPSRINNKQYKKLGYDNEGYKFPLLGDVIVPGESPNARDIVTAIKANTMNPPDEHFDELKEYAQNMTRDEMQQKFKEFDLLYANIYENFQKLEDRITGTGKFDKGITTKEEYDKLPDTDPLKRLLETTAVLNSYYSIPDKKQYYSSKMTPKELEQIKSIIRKEARENFNYTFGKSPDIAEAGMINSTNEIHSLLENYQKSTGEKPDDIKIKNIIASLKRFDKSDFNGSMKHTIDLMINSFRKSLNTSIESEEAYAKREQLIQNVRSVLEKNMYLNIGDLNSSAFKRDNLPAVEKWIDDIFDPVNDKEFVRIYNTLLDMPSDKFREKYNHLLTDEALGIKPLTGYDILKKYRAMDSKIQDAVYNVYFSREYCNNVDVSKTTPCYTYTKLSRILDGGKYGKNKKSFDDIFLDYYYSLYNLTLEKGYGKLKNLAYKKYGVFPSYAKVETENPEAIEQELAAMRYNILEAVESSNSIKGILETIKNVKEVRGILDRYPDKNTLSEDDYTAVIAFALKVYNEYKDDDSIPAAVTAASKLPLLPPDTEAKKFKKHINAIYNEFVPLETTAEGKPFASEIKKYAEKVKEEKQEFVSESIEPKYQKKAYELLNKWVQARSKKETNADIYFDEFAKLYDKHRITLAPQVLFKTYLMMLAKPTNTNNPYKTMSEKQRQNIEEMKKTYEDELASLLNSAKVVEMQNILMRAARNGNLNIVQKELQNSKIPLKNGKVIDLYSKEGLTIMLKDLIDAKDTETVLLFIDQLGLSELAVETLAGYISFDNARKILKRSYNIFDAVDKQFKIVEAECGKLEDIDTDPNWKARMEHSRDIMIKACNNSNFKNTKKIIESFMNNLIEEMEKHPDISKYKLLSENMQYAKAGAIEYAKNNVDSLNESLEKVQVIYNLLHEIQLPPKSGCEKYINEFDQKLGELEKYSDSLSHHFDTIDITVGRSI